MNKALLVLVIFLTFIVIVLALILFTTPVKKRTESTSTAPVATSTPQKPATNEPLSARIVVSTPKSGASVGSTFEVKGSAPGSWFFEASFPIQVRDNDGNVLARTHANALGEWMTVKNVDFQATVHIDSAYKGEATLILLKDNPSGLPENDDSVEVPILIQ